MRTWRVISIIAENKPHAHHKTYLHTMKVYNTHYRSFDNCDFSFFPTTKVFTCYNVIKSLSFLSFLRKRAWLWSRNDSYSQFPRSPLGTPGSTAVVFCVLNTKKIKRLAGLASLRKQRD